MEEKDPDKLKDAISKVGPGYQRFRLQEQLYALLGKRRYSTRINAFGTKGSDTGCSGT